MFNKNMFKAQLVLLGMTMKDLAEELSINESTLYRKINANGDFSREEINQMIRIMKFSDPMKVFFA